MSTEAGKGSKQRPTNKIAYDTNYDTIFGRKYLAEEAKERCEICGCMVHDPCEDIPPDICEKGAQAFYV